MKKIVIAIVIVLICLLLYFIVVPLFIKQADVSSINNIDNEVLSEQEVNAFNMLFLSYEGTQKGTMLKSLISNVESSNVEYAGEREILCLRT